MKHTLALLVLTFTFSAYALMSDPNGSYSEGTLADAECLQETGEGYMQLYRDMERMWGTSEIISMIVGTGRDMESKYPGRDRLQVEDISAEHGGDITDHGSHENGLDVDIEFYKANGQEHNPTHKRDFAQPMVNTDGSVSGNFDVERNWEVMKALHRNGKIAKIFIDTKLKQSICRYVREKGELSSGANVLRSLQHEPNHQDHMHVRLQCPPNKRSCQGQVARTTGATGC